MEDVSLSCTNSYRSGAIEIDATHRRLVIDGAPAKVGGRAFDVLLALVERRDRLVPKRELMDVVWPVQSHQCRRPANFGRSIFRHIAAIGRYRSIELEPSSWATRTKP